MRGGDRYILVGLPLIAILVGFWFLALQPKREQSAELGERVEVLQGSIQAAEGQIAAAEAAREAFPKNYGELVTLGRAVPEDGDQATLLYDLAGLAKANEVKFRDFALLDSGTGAEGAPAAPPPPSEPAEGEGTGPPEEGTAASAPPATPAVATEAVAASLPLGATVGPAGLPTMPYQFKFLGGFFEIADFFAALDRNVSVRGGKPTVGGRLMTIDGFSLTADPFTGFPDVQADFAVTTYVVPAEQGMTAGATAAGPPPVGPADSNTVSTPVPAAGVTP